MANERVKPVKPINERWPIDFLERQLAILEGELADKERWSNKVKGNLKGSARLSSVNTDDLSIENTLSYASTGFATLLNAELAKVKLAIGKIQRDLVSKKGPHYYGRCNACEYLIPSTRLGVVAWATFCINCQKSLERPAMAQGKSGISYSARRTASHLTQRQTL
jgi:RNA polymerase-binding transcription factor DksA